MDFSTSFGANGTGNSGTVTIGTNPNRLIVVSISAYKNGSTSRHVSSMNLGGSPLTKLTEINSPDDKMRTEIWYYLNPPSGSNNLAMTWAINTEYIAGYMFYSGVDQTTPFADVQNYSANSGDPNLVLSSECGGIVHDVIARRTNGSFTPGAGQTELWDKTWSTVLTGTANNENGSLSVPMTHTSDDNGKAFAHCAISMKPSATQIEICGNSLDDDCDGLVDCDDPDCGVAITGEEMGKVASNVYSQVDFTSAVYNALDSTFASPTDVAIDPTTGKFFISDPGGNRILRYASEATFFTGGKAEGVLGQPDFLTTGFITPPTANTLRNPSGIAIDSNGNLYVADYYNRRVLRYDNVSAKANGAAADAVLGQPNFTSITLYTTQSGMDYVADVVVHPNGSLIVAGKNNRRVLIFNNAASLGNGAPADVVLGKPDFTSNSPFTCTSTNIASAWYMELIGNSLYLSDLTCHRVLVWDDVFSKSNGAAADRVLGQSNFTASSILLDQKAIVQGTGFEKDDAGNLYIADSYHDRILFFEDANSLANGANAKSVYGQPDFVTTGPGTSATQFKDPRGMEMIEYNGQSYLMVLDKQNYRALFFPQSVSTDELTAVSGTLHGSDPASTGSLTFSVVTQPVLGSVSIDNASTGAFTYTPTGACMLSEDSTLTFTYRITNGNSCFLETSISIFVTDVAPCPEICGNGIDDNGDGRIDEDLPAGVGDNLLLWLRADIGFGGGTWLDQSPNGNDANVFGDPTQIANSMNFNPGINFDGDDHVEVNLPELVFQSGNNHVVIFAVYKPSTAAFDIGMYGNQTATDVQNIYLQWNQVGKGNGSVVTTTPFGIKPHLITHIVDEEDNVGGGVNETELYHNGTLDLTYLFNETSSADVDLNFHIGKGGSHPTTSKYFLGDIHEIIIYFENDGNPSITTSERQKIESYLGVKYGITLVHDYTNSQ